MLPAPGRSRYDGTENLTHFHNAWCISPVRPYYILVFHMLIGCASLATRPILCRCYSEAVVNINIKYYTVNLDEFA